MTGRRAMRGAFAAAGVVLLGAALLSPGPARAAERKIEAVGAVPVREGDRSDPRKRAVATALREAVHRVAEELLMDAVMVDTGRAGEEAAAEGPDLDAVLGTDAVPYTPRFKVTEDRGIGPALFVEEPGVATEYVIVAEVVVEVDRVRERLVRAGLLAPELDLAPVGQVRLEVEGLSVYPAYQALQALLTGPVGAETAVPLRFEHGRALIGVGTALAAPDLVSRLERSAPPELSIVPLAANGGDARIAVRWTPPPEAERGDEAPARGHR